MGRARRGGPHHAATGKRVDVTGEQIARELAELDQDVADALAAIESVSDHVTTATQGPPPLPSDGHRA